MSVRWFLKAWWASFSIQNMWADDNDGVVSQCLTCFHVVMMIIMLWPWSGYLWQSPPAMCAVHHQGLHPASLWAALISQKQPEIFSLTKLLRPHLDYKPPFPSDKIDQSAGCDFFTLGHNFIRICSQLQNMILGERLIKSPVILLPPATERRVPPGPAQRSARDNFTENSIPGWKWLIVFKTELGRGGGRWLGTPVTCY